MLIAAHHAPCERAGALLVEAGHRIAPLDHQPSHDCATALWVRLEPVDAAMLDRFPKLRYVVTPCTGTDHIDLAECERRGIEVLSLKSRPGLEKIPATAELTIGLILALTRRIHVARSEGWDRYQFQGTDLAGKRALVVGPGRIGSTVVKLLTAFGVQVDVAGKGCDLDAAIWVGKPDIVTLHADLCPENELMMSAVEFAAMKPGSYFINTARGQLVDQSALLSGLVVGGLAAALDVLWGEPEPWKVPSSAALMEFARSNPARLIITPHIGGNTRESVEMAEGIMARALGPANASVSSPALAQL